MKTTLTTGGKLLRRGFTIIEIMVVIAIISLLMALTISIVGKVGEKAKITTCSVMISDLSRAIDSYKSCFGRYPKDYLPNFSYLPSESGSESEQVRWKSSCVLVLALTHSHIDAPGTKASCPCKGSGPFFDSFKLGENAVHYEDTNIPAYPQDVSNPYSLSYLTFEGMGLPSSAGRPAIQLLDPWGNEIIYDEKRAFYNKQIGKPSLHDSYENTDYVGVTFISGGDYQNDFAFKMPYILYSLGPNLSDDTHEASSSEEIKHGDDIGNW